MWIYDTIRQSFLCPHFSAIQRELTIFRVTFSQMQNLWWLVVQRITHMIISLNHKRLLCSLKSIGITLNNYCCIYELILGKISRQQWVWMIGTFIVALKIHLVLSSRPLCWEQDQHRDTHTVFMAPPTIQLIELLFV